MLTAITLHPETGKTCDIRQGDPKHCHCGASIPLPSIRKPGSGKIPFSRIQAVAESIDKACYWPARASISLDTATERTPA